MLFVPCKVEHIKALMHVGCRDISGVDPESLREHIEGSMSFAGFAGGACQGAAGLIDIWQGRSLVWALFAPSAGPYMRAITRHVNFVLANHGSRRYECAVDPTFNQGVKWMRVLGFECEAPVMRNFSKDGTSMSLYARIK
jgi:hypothetical protein